MKFGVLIKSALCENTHTRQQQTPQTWRTDLWLPRERRERREKDWEFGFSRCKLLENGKTTRF